MSISIQKISGKIIKDSRGKDTVQAELITSDGKKYIGAVPSGQSVGGNEAKTQTPADAVSTISDTMNTRVHKQKFSTIDEVDDILYAIAEDIHLEIGANALLPVSIASMHALAASYNLPTWRYISEITGIKPNIPTPMMVMIEGGKHGAFDGVSWQEYLLNAPVEVGTEFLDALKDKLTAQSIPFAQGTEGGLSIDVATNYDALELFMYVFNLVARDYSFSIDCAATHNTVDEKELTILVSHKELLSIEDPAQEEDWDSWVTLMKKYGSHKLIVGDDLTTTSYDRLQKAITMRACNAVIIKPNQIGSVSQTLKTARLAHTEQIAIIVSHRAGETTDTFIADLGVGIGARSIKSGAPIQKERMAKYIRLAEIIKEINYG